MNSENNITEYKEKLTEDFEKEVVAFLNYKHGGIIYIGIDKNGKPVGVEDIDNVQLKIKDRIKNNILPSTLGLYDIYTEFVDDIEVIKLIISSGIDKPYYIKKKGMTPEGCYIRVGSSKEQLTERMINRMFAKRIKNPLKELNSPRQKLTFNQLKIHYEGKNVKLTDKFLENLDLLTSEGKYNYNAFLLADENNISLKVVKYKGNTKIEIERYEEFGYTCLITVTNQILDKLKVENDTYAKIGYPKRQEVKKFDPVAVKEAVLNAILHNDYSYGNEPIIEFYADRVEITSYGGIPEELSKEDFLEGVTVRRNKELVKIFKDIDLIENVGSGILRILEAYDENCFKFMDNFLRVSFKYKENPFIYREDTHSSKNDTINDTINGTINDTIKLLDNEENVFKLIQSNPSITREQIVIETKLSDRTISRILKVLQDKGVIKREGSRKNGIWKIINENNL